MMSKTEINRIARVVCESNVRCPIYDAGADCSCDASKPGKCPLRHALYIAAEIDEKAEKQPIRLTYAYTDDWGRPTYEADNGRRYKDVNCGKGKPSLHSVTSAGEPDCPVHFKYTIVNAKR